MYLGLNSVTGQLYNTTSWFVLQKYSISSKEVLNNYLRSLCVFFQGFTADCLNVEEQLVPIRCYLQFLLFHFMCCENSYLCTVVSDMQLFVSLRFAINTISVALSSILKNIFVYMF